MTDPLVIAAVILLIIMIMAPFVILRRRRRAAQAPEPAPVRDMSDAHYAHAHGLTLAQWDRLKPREQAALRQSAAHGANMRRRAS